VSQGEEAVRVVAFWLDKADARFVNAMQALVRR
jgi:hypothetical protein